MEKLQKSGEGIVLRKTSPVVRSSTPSNISHQVAHLSVATKNVENHSGNVENPNGEQSFNKKSKKSKKSSRQAEHNDEEIELADLTAVVIERARKRTRSKSRTSKKKRLESNLEKQNQQVYASKSEPRDPPRNQNVHGVPKASFGESTVYVLMDNATLPVPESQPVTSMQRRGSESVVLALKPTNETELSKNESVEAHELDTTLDHGDERQNHTNKRSKSESESDMYNTTHTPAEVSYRQHHEHKRRQSFSVNICNTTSKPAEEEDDDILKLANLLDALGTSRDL